MTTNGLKESAQQSFPNSRANPDSFANDQWFVALYSDLRRIAERELRSYAGATLGPTTLLHETFLSVSQRDAVAFPDRARFIVYTARAMRGLMIDYVRSRQAYKRGSEFEITSLPTEPGQTSEQDFRLEKLNEALESLAQVDASLAEYVDLKFFCGLSIAEIAQLQNISERTVHRTWNKARLVLRHLMTDAPDAMFDAR